MEAASMVAIAKTRRRVTPKDFLIVFRRFIPLPPSGVVTTQAVRICTLIDESTSPSRANDAQDTCAGDEILSSVSGSVEQSAGHHETFFGDIFDDENIFQNMGLYVESRAAGQLVEVLPPAASSRAPVRWSQIARLAV
jgi:hypothetical protein